MPIYEYLCLDCHHRFEELRSMGEADAPIACQQCGGTHTARKISLFAAHSDGTIVAGSAPVCTSCTTHNCSSCGSLH